MAAKLGDTYRVNANNLWHTTTDAALLTTDALFVKDIDAKLVHCEVVRDGHGFGFISIPHYVLSKDYTLQK